MAKNVLRVMHAALTHPAARPILGRLSEDDMDTLADHISAGTLMAGLTPLADAATKAEAMRAMPRDLANVISKLPADHVSEMRNQLSRLDRDADNNLMCPC